MDSRADGGGALLPQLVHFLNGREGQAVLRHGFGADKFFVRNGLADRLARSSFFIESMIPRWQ